MDFFDEGVICTKNRLWKKKKLVLEIVDTLKGKGYHFVEMVYGEPNDFVFADRYEEIEERLSMKGFFGIRIKMEKDGILLSVESNTNGIDNVKYSVFAETDGSLRDAVRHCKELKEIIKPSNDTVAKVEEKFANSRQLRTAFVVVAVIAGVLLVNELIPIISIATSIFMFAPLLFIYIAVTYFRRR